MTEDQKKKWLAHLEGLDRDDWNKLCNKCSCRIFRFGPKCGLLHKVNYDFENNVEYKECKFELCPFVFWAPFLFRTMFRKPMFRKPIFND